jgi:phospholipid-binding lipoprotein MlaA
MHNKFKSALFFILPFLFVLFSTHNAAAVQDLYQDNHFSNHGFQFLLAESDVFDDDFYFPDDLMDEEPEYHIADPLRPFNVAMFHFNDKLYFWVLKPVARGWRAVVPQTARTGISNFFYNLGFPIRFVSSVLQLKGDKATGELGRFFLNSTFGVLGFGNPAKNFKELNPEAEDLGQTFGRYGVGHGFYLVLPVFGPSSLRDTVGRVGDSFLNPVIYLDSNEVIAGIKTMDIVNRTSFRIGDYEALKAAALEPYEAMKSGYLQRRLKSVNN